MRKKKGACCGVVDTPSWPNVAWCGSGGGQQPNDSRGGRDDGRRRALVKTRLRWPVSNRRIQTG